MITADKTTDTARTVRTVTQTARSGRVSTVETSLTMTEALDVLRSMKGNDFARSLIEQSARNLSESSYRWIFIVAQQHVDRLQASVSRGPATTTVRPVPTAAPVAVAVPATPAPVSAPVIGDMAPVYGLFQIARAALKRPKIRIQTADGRPVVLTVAGDRSRYAGSITVTTGDPFGTPGSFFGYIHADGTTTVRDAAVVDVLVKFAADPAGVAAQYGRTHDECAFCRRPLSNGEAGSTSVGYGPVCAARWGLPWNPNGKTYAVGEGQPIQIGKVA